MSDRYFIDSNIWLYVPIEGESDKTRIAREIVVVQPIIISTQVINEVTFNLLKKCHYSEPEIQQFITNISDTYEIKLVTSKTSLKASYFREKYPLSFWDSLIVASAIESDCNILYSEDMQHKMIIQDTQIINPFLCEN